MRIRQAPAAAFTANARATETIIVVLCCVPLMPANRQKKTDVNDDEQNDRPVHENFVVVVFLLLCCCCCLEGEQTPGNHVTESQTDKPNRTTREKQNIYLQSEKEIGTHSTFDIFCCVSSILARIKTVINTTQVIFQLSGRVMSKPATEACKIERSHLIYRLMTKNQNK